MARRSLLYSLIFCSLLVSVSGQQPQPPQSQTSAPKQQNPPGHNEQDIIRITTNLVQVDVVVTKDGKPVTDLDASDFDLFEDGRPQTITNFSYISNVPESGAGRVAPARSKDKSAPTAPPVRPAKINSNDQRRTIALVVDDLGISLESMPHVRSQIRKFLDTIPPNDLVAIIRTGGDVGSLQQFTNDRRLLQSAADHLRWNQCSRAGLHVFPRLGDPGENASLCSQGTLVATIESLRFILRGMSYLPGRKSMVLLSDFLPIEDQDPSTLAKNSPDASSGPRTGGPPMTESRINYYDQLQRVAELAIRSAVVIYAVDTRGLQTTGLMAADEVSAPNLTRPNLAAMQREVSATVDARSRALLAGREGSDLIAKQTGGFFIHNSNGFDLDRVMEDQQGYYLIGFRPTEETFNRKFHHLRARLKRKGLTVRTRAGFYGFTDEQAHPLELSVADQMNKALLSPFGANEVMAQLTSFFVDDASQGPLLRSFLYLDPHDLTFTEGADGWHVAKLDLRAVLFGDNGKVIDLQDQTGTLRFRGAGYERAQRDGIVHSFDTPVKQSGAFQFRVAIRDLGSSRIGASGQFVEVPDLRNGQLALSGIFAREAPSQGNAVAAARQSSTNNEVEMVTAGPGVRRFRQGSTVIFAYAIYNSNVESSANSAQLSAQTRVFRDGKPVFTGELIPVGLEGQPDRRRITNVSLFQLGSEMLPGEYIVQIIVADSSKQKSRAATQWIDFEVVK